VPDRCSTASRGSNEPGQSEQQEHVDVPGNSIMTPYLKRSCDLFESYIPGVEGITPSTLSVPTSITHSGKSSAGIGVEHYHRGESPYICQRANNKKLKGYTADSERPLATQQKKQSELSGDDNRPGIYSISTKSRDPGEEQTYACLFFMNNPHRWKHVKSCRQRYSLSRLRQVYSLLYREHLNACLPKADTI
jgi:hypothetical protein